MKTDRFMLLVVFLNLVMGIFNFLQGDISTGFGWLAAWIWSVRSHGQAMRIRELERGGREDDDFTRFLG